MGSWKFDRSQFKGTELSAIKEQYEEIVSDLQIADAAHILPSSYSVQEIPVFGESPYYDFLSFSKKVNDFDRSFLTKSGNGRYELGGGYEPLYVYYSQEYSNLNIKGSLAWHIQGHNLFFDQNTFEDAVHYVSSKLGTDLFDAGVKQLEVSRVIRTDFPVREIQDHHFWLDGFDRVMKQNTLYYNLYTRRENYDKVLKLYDVVKNAIKKKMTMIPDGNVIKYEIKLYNPSKVFDQKAITISDLVFDADVLNKIYSEMKQHYKNIQVAGNTVTTGKHLLEDVLIAVILSKRPDLIQSAMDRIGKLPVSDKVRSNRRVALKEHLGNVIVTDSPYRLKL